MSARQKAACLSVGTKQCAALCLSNLPSYEPGGCPHVADVWTDEAVLRELARRPDGPLAPHCRTALQILQAPKNAFFVRSWGKIPSYCANLARALSRHDVTIIPPDQVRSRTMGVPRHIVVDHDCRLARDQWDYIRGHSIWVVGE